MNGILPLWKPKGVTSFDCVRKVRHLFNMKKVGHTGTLDPEVEGVLVICLGKATRLVPFLTDTNKVYQSKVKLGIATETEDQTGAVVEKKKVDEFPDESQIKNVLKKWTGTITQTPPMYSAVKVNGKRLYEYARNNETVERPSRQVKIHELKYLGKTPNTNDEFSIYVKCSKGTYIRTLCVDIGKSLNYPSHMSHLVRLETSNFKKEETFTFTQLEELKENGELEKCLSPYKRAVIHLPQYEVTAEKKKQIQHGQLLKNPIQDKNITQLALLYNNELLAIYKVDQNNTSLIRPVRVFKAI